MVFPSVRAGTVMAVLRTWAPWRWASPGADWERSQSNPAAAAVPADLTFDPGRRAPVASTGRPGEAARGFRGLPETCHRALRSARHRAAPGVVDEALGRDTIWVRGLSPSALSAPGRLVVMFEVDDQLSGPPAAHG